MVVVLVRVVVVVAVAVDVAVAVVVAVAVHGDHNCTTTGALGLPERPANAFSSRGLSLASTFMHE